MRDDRDGDVRHPTDDEELRTEKEALFVEMLRQQRAAAPWN
jgi:hypothetical protein